MPAVAAAPSTVKRARRRTRALLLSAMAPTSGAISATRKLAVPLAIPRRKVLSVAGTPAFQNCLKKSGKKPAMTVVAKEEFAQSYIAHPNTGRRVNTRRLPAFTAVAVSITGVLAGFVEGDVGPALHGQLQIDPGGC